MTGGRRALTVRPGEAGSVRLEPVDAPAREEGTVLVRALAVGVCGTDRDIVEGCYGTAPPGRDRLILGHESLGEVLEAPDGCGLAPGDRVVGIVRRPDPVPCASCAAGEWDMCRNGRYTERGIRARDGFTADVFRIEPDFAVRVDPALGVAGVLLEPASVLAKAWEHVERIGRRAAAWAPRTALVTGAGPVGLLAALLGRQRGLAVHVFDRATGGPKPALVRDLGAVYHHGALADLDVEPDVLVECTGAAPVVADAMARTAPAGVVCLAGLSLSGGTLDVDVGLVNRRMVLENDAVFGSVNANRRHYVAAARALAGADPAWLARIVTRRVPLDRFADALRDEPDDVKVVIDFHP